VTTGVAGTALVLVDLQRDFLGRPGLVPHPSVITARAAGLLTRARALRLPVVHVQTQVRADGSDRMPHWASTATMACVAGTPGAAAPDALTPADGELVVAKQFFTGFGGAPDLDAWLRERDAQRVVVAGVFLHGCVRATALDAYERGYEVVVADDAVGDDDAVHAAATRAWLDGRAARFVPAEQAFAGPRLGTERPLVWFSAQSPMARPVEERVGWLRRWADVLEAEAPGLVDLMIEEIGKPRRAAADEVRRAVAHVRTAAELVPRQAADRQIAPGVVVRQCPVGTVGLVLPWNNPIAIAAGKIAPALGFGNRVVAKPAPEATRCAAALVATLEKAGVPDGLVVLAPGGVDVALALCDDPAVDAVSVTGPIAAGRAIAARCTAMGKPVQGELGGNNAAIVLADAELDAVASALAHAAFDFAGQRCTAIRRIIVDARVADALIARMIAATGELVVGDPADERTDVGPLVSRAAADRVAAIVDAARERGATVLCGGQRDGSFVAPCLVTDVAADDPIAQEETFGPVAVVLPVADVDEALAVANGVSQGLVLAVCTDDVGARARVLAGARAGIVQLGAGPLPVHADAPFGGWGASVIGPPEHGEWDAAFYTRPQAVYTTS
jgi:alpha-ketoglutaric semialdehyde dehydrogenase